VTLAAAGLGAAVVTFAVGLNASLNLVQAGQNLTRTVPVRVTSVRVCGAAGGQPMLGPPGTPGQGLTARQQRTIKAALGAQPQTLHSVAEADVQARAAGTGLAAGALAVPAGIALHRYVLPVMFAAVDTGLPASFLNVYGGWEVAGLALAGLVIAVAGALLPASWAARAPAASALHAE